jgi:nucleoside-diphosphate-sugar epimerase
MKTILVTGGFGYVGSRLTPLLLERGYRVKVLDLCLYGDYGYDALKSDPSYSKWSERFSLIRGDIRDPDIVAAATKGVTTIIHLAAVSNDPTGDIDETLTRQVNFDAVGLLIVKAKENGVARFINASSSSVFGIKDMADVTEEIEPEPITFYSKYKMLAEWIVRGAASDDFCAVNIRPATICGYSPRQRFDLTVNKLTADAIKKQIITVHGGEQRRPNVGMEDVINLYAQLIETDSSLINGKTFNFGFENHKIIDIAKIIEQELIDLNPKVQITEVFDQRDYHISSKYIQSVLHYVPVSSIKNEVAELRKQFENGAFQDIDAPQYYNLKVMKLDRSSKSFDILKQG